MNRISNQRDNIGEGSFFKKLENTINKKKQNEVPKKVVKSIKSKKKSEEINEMLNAEIKNLTLLNILYFTLVEIDESFSRHLNTNTTQTLH